MRFVVKVQTTYNCSLERAFKTAILCDLSKIHTGLGIMPKVTHTTDDENWGKVGSTKKVFVGKSMTQKGGYGSQDKILERRENEYWKIEVSDFQSWMLGFYKFEGEWETILLAKEKIQINYTYTLYSKAILLRPFNWMFAKLFWKKYMNQVLDNIRKMTANKEPYQYD